MPPNLSISNHGNHIMPFLGPRFQPQEKHESENRCKTLAKTFSWNLTLVVSLPCQPWFNRAKFIDFCPREPHYVILGVVFLGSSSQEKHESKNRCKNLIKAFSWNLKLVVSLPRHTNLWEAFPVTQKSRKKVAELDFFSLSSRGIFWWFGTLSGVSNLRALNSPPSRLPVPSPPCDWSSGMILA